MKSFLEYVADDIIAKFGTDLSRVAVVFPNKRASLWLSDYLVRSAGRPVWSPSYLTISELFRQHSSLKVADNIKLVCDLYKCYVHHTQTSETLDHFFGWGQVLLSDFDDLDKNMADPSHVFANLRDLHEYDDVSYLSQAQKLAVSQFFSSFSDKASDSPLKERFLYLWTHVADVYSSFNAGLRRQGMAYEGALYREVALAEHLDLRYNHYIFVGFNLIQAAQRRLFSAIKSQGRASFYWDFDKYYMSPSSTNEAGHYIAKYLEEFPNELESTSDEIYGCFSTSKTINFVSAFTDNLQARYVSQWLTALPSRMSSGRRTAIVLCDEQLLPAVLTQLPTEVSKANVTTGYPLSLSPAAQLAASLFDLQTLGYDHKRKAFRPRYLSTVLSHPYVVALPEQSSLQLHKKSTPSDLLGWLSESLMLVARQSSGVADGWGGAAEGLFRTYTLVQRLQSLCESGDLTVGFATLQRLFRHLLASTSIPFHGEPAEGLQVMGVLETRNLDFDHLLILSCGEGHVPRAEVDLSLIPHTLRRAYGLTTSDHKVSIYSYYFHRLLQRANDVTIVYNNATADGHTGEMSRFMLQLMVESSQKINFFALQSGQSVSPFHPTSVEKTPEVISVLRSSFEGKLLSPTAINRYLRCPLQFYYYYVRQLREPDTKEDEALDNRIFGNVFHAAAQFLYSQLTRQSNVVTSSAIDLLLKNPVYIRKAVDKAFLEELSKLSPSKSGHQLELSGLQLVSREVIVHYLRSLLELDKQSTPITIIGLEIDVIQPYTIEIVSKDGLPLAPIRTNIGGRVDRLDEVGGQMRIIDYKTGSRLPKSLPDVGSVFLDQYIKEHSDYYLQTLIYANIYRRTNQKPVAPALLFIQHAAAKGYDPVLSFAGRRIHDVADTADDFWRMLDEKIKQMFDPKVPFVPTTEPHRCQNCPYSQLCSPIN